MKITGFFSTGMVAGVLAIVLFCAIAAQGEENQAPSDIPLPDTATNSVSTTAQPPEVDTDSAYGELVRLVQAGVDQSILLSYVENTVRFFELDADRIIYLVDLGVPSKILDAVMQHDKQLYEEEVSAAAAPPPEEQIAEHTNNPPPEVTEDYLYDTLAPYGSWIYIEGYGRCWQPTVVVYNANWRPYCDNGRWVYTDSGWYWMSDYSWGWAAFHYGRWFRHVHYGWCWWPDTVWAPSWVSWRYDRTYCGWAPLPPYTSCRSGSGIFYRGRRVGVGFNFHLDSECYTFVATRYFCDPNPRRYCLDRRDAKRVYGRTRVFNRINYDVRKQRVVNSGISPSIISTLSRQTVSPVTVHHTADRAGQTNRREQLNRDTRTLVVSRPNTAGSQGNRSAARVHNGIPQNHVSRQRSYTTSAGRTTVRQPVGQVNRTSPSSTRPSRSVSQAKQRHTRVPAVGTSTSRSVTHVQSPSQRGNSSTLVSQGNRSAGSVSGQGQVNSRNTRSSASQSGKSTNSGRAKGHSRHSRPGVGNGSR